MTRLHERRKVNGIDDEVATNTLDRVDETVKNVLLDCAVTISPIDGMNDNR